MTAESLSRSELARRLGTSERSVRRAVADGALVGLDQTFYLHSHPGATRTIYLDFNGATIANVGNKGLALLVNLGAFVGGTAPTITFKLQGSPDGGTNWYDIAGAASPVLTAAGAYPISIGRSRLQSLIQAAGSNTALNARYVRLAAVTVGSTTVVWGVYSPFKLKQFPVNGYVNGVNYTLLGD